MRRFLWRLRLRVWLVVFPHRAAVLRARRRLRQWDALPAEVRAVEHERIERAWLGLVGDLPPGWPVPGDELRAA